MNDVRPFNDLRAQDRTRWHDYRAIAGQNAALPKDGQQPSNQQLIKEQKAIEAVQIARSELLAAINRLVH